MKRPIFVFAGQSNMMGAAVFPEKRQIYFKDSFEYKHKDKRMGNSIGSFKSYGFPSGEFSYKSISKAYGEKPDPSIKSSLSVYRENAYFVSSLANLKNEETKECYDFGFFSEATAPLSPSIPPYIIDGLEKEGIFSLYTHISRGAVSISYYLEGDAADYFDIKVSDFFEDSKKKFPEDDLSEKILVWLQGESDARNGYDFYLNGLRALWEKAQRLGFTKFFIIRVGFWGKEEIKYVMKAQEDFCKEVPEAYMLTRVCSYMKYKGQNEEGFILPCESDEFKNCRDSFYGFRNQHLNIKGMKLIAKYAVPNIIRILKENKEPILEEEKIVYLRGE